VTIAIRADASAATGIGHVKRCLALAEAAAAFGERTIFVCAGTIPPALAEEVRRACELRFLRPGYPVSPRLRRWHLAAALRRTSASRAFWQLPTVAPAHRQRRSATWAPTSLARCLSPTAALVKRP